MANVYLLVTDLHKSPISKDNRFNYQSEVAVAEKEIISNIEKYKSRGNTVYLIFLGDIVDRGIKDSDQAMKVKNEVAFICSKAKQCFTVLGNHEKSFAKGNPFWHLVKDVQSTKINRAEANTLKGKGKSNILNIVDKLVDGEVEFIFNHHSLGISPASKDKISIGLVHQPIVFREILDEAKLKNRELFELDENIMENEYNYVYLERRGELVSNYNYMFLAHLHKLYGVWNVDDCEMNFLSSLGRPNCTEVLDNFLERDIPAVIVDNGKFIGIEHNKFNLPSRKISVNEAIVKSVSERYQRNKKLNEIKGTKLYNENPVDNVKLAVGEELASVIIDAIIRNEEDPVYEEIKYYGRNL